MAENTTITAARLREVLDYNPKTGEFRWLERRRGRRTKIGTIKKDPGRVPCIQLQIERRRYPAHCIAWLWMTGSWPEREIRHINKDRLDNRWENLKLWPEQSAIRLQIPRLKKKRKRIVTFERLREVMHYNPDTGKFTWLIRGKGRSRDGVVGCPRNDGYLTTGLDYGDYLLHILAYFWMTGKYPDRIIDHVNGIRSDNRWSNLRISTPQQNNWNQRRISKKHGYVGVYLNWSSKKNPWRVQIDNRYIGSYATEQEAVEAYTREAIATRGEYGKKCAPRRDWLIVSSHSKGLRTA